MIYTLQNSPSEVQFAALRPGDRVQLPYRNGKPWAFRFALPWAGTPDAPIVLEGIPDPITGALPTITGENAVTDPQFAVSYAPLEQYGLVSVWRTVKSGNVTPASVLIQNLRITGAKDGNSFTGADGTVQKWYGGASGIYCLLCAGLTVRNCQIDDNGQGVFVGDSYESSDVRLDGNTIFGNGWVGNYSYHQTYVQACRATYRNNKYGPQRPGALGGALKDRSADVLVRGNVIEADLRALDFGPWQNQTALRKAAPNASRVVVDGNVLTYNAKESVALVHCPYDYGDDRAPQIAVTNNTFRVRRDQSESYYEVAVSNDSTPTASVTFAGNVFDFRPATPGKPVPEFRANSIKGAVNYGPNWSNAPPVNSSYGAGAPPASGLENVKVFPGVAPGYRDEANGDYSLVPGAPATGFGASAAPVPPPPPPPVVPPPPPPPPAWVQVGSTVSQLSADGKTRVDTSVFVRGAAP